MPPYPQFVRVVLHTHTTHTATIARTKCWNLKLYLILYDLLPYTQVLGCTKCIVYRMKYIVSGELRVSYKNRYYALKNYLNLRGEEKLKFNKFINIQFIIFLYLKFFIQWKHTQNSLNEIRRTFFFFEKLRSFLDGRSCQMIN